MTAAVLAVMAIPLVAREWKAARIVVWLFTIEGTVDLAVATTLATVYGAAPFMGRPTGLRLSGFLTLLVTRDIAFLTLPNWKTAGAAQPAPLSRSAW